MTLKKWFLVGTFGVGILSATMFIVMFWLVTAIKPPISRIVLNYLMWMAGGFVWGGFMYIYSWIIIKIRNKAK
jgi:hypothetical protein